MKTFSDETLALHTEQVIVDGNHNTTHSFASNTTPDKVFRIDVPDIKAAQQLQMQKIGANTGVYDKYTNSCLTEASKVLNAGGANLPTHTNEAIRYLQAL